MKTILQSGKWSWLFFWNVKDLCSSASRKSVKTTKTPLLIRTKRSQNWWRIPRCPISPLQTQTSVSLCERMHFFLEMDHWYYSLETNIQHFRGNEESYLEKKNLFRKWLLVFGRNFQSILVYYQIKFNTWSRKNQINRSLSYIYLEENKPCLRMTKIFKNIYPNKSILFNFMIPSFKIFCINLNNIF